MSAVTKKRVTLQFPVPAGYSPGDYCRLFGNGGSGDIDFDTPLNNFIYPTHPNHRGLMGYGNAPYGAYPYGSIAAVDVLGYGCAPYGAYPYGLGCIVIEAVIEVDDCGYYKFAFGAFDAAGNAHAGDPAETAREIHVAPEAPAGLKAESYNTETDQLTVSVLT